ncbi:hypothetical protein [Tepidimicrobium xylanilyticum]|uniref:Uncharacterized protein n=1 Tax=Tepidimicrobium xylanilyticum TaxID=1123352 RepID=A0A1H3DQY5_9FIRM|nr:hypothetical protein [Tepidimicrobium xylanilyticum]SDX68074.1 hypothetical protein SAMN05660923_02720 [Tepidimicrobium xylanilyticum]
MAKYRQYSSECWGTMITPELKGGHEVIISVYVEEAEVRDPIPMFIESIRVTLTVVAYLN